MPESFLGNQGKTSPTPIFHFWVFRFYDILTFEYKFNRMHIVISMAHPGISQVSLPWWLSMYLQATCF